MYSSYLYFQLLLHSSVQSPHQPPGLFSFQHEVLVKDVNCNCTVCSRESLRDSAGVEFICTDLILNANYALLITVNVSQPDVLIHYLCKSVAKMLIALLFHQGYPNGMNSLKLGEYGQY